MSSTQKDRALRVSKRLGALLDENAAKAGVHVVVTPRQSTEAALTEQARKIIADLRDSKRVVDKDVLAWLMGGSPGLKLALHSRKLDLRAYTRSRRNVSRRDPQELGFSTGARASIVRSQPEPTNPRNTA